VGNFVMKKFRENIVSALFTAGWVELSSLYDMNEEVTKFISIFKRTSLLLHS
jgi:hypothetical protein